MLNHDDLSVSSQIMDEQPNQYDVDNDSEMDEQHDINMNCDERSYGTVSTSLDCQEKNKKYTEYKMANYKGYSRFVHVVNNKKYIIEAYGTNTDPGCIIRDAVTGGTFGNFKIGSSDENLFFKAKFSDGQDGLNRNCNTFYYFNPDHYENHTHTTLSSDIKNKWNEKYRKEIARRE